MSQAVAPFPIGALVLDADDLQRIVIGVKPDGRVMTVGAPDLPSLAACPRGLLPA